MRLWQHYDLVKHAIEVVALVPFWPIRARRYMRKLRAQEAAADARVERLAAEVIDLRARAGLDACDLVPLVAAVADTVTALQGIAPQVRPVPSGRPVRLRAVP